MAKSNDTLTIDNLPESAEFYVLTQEVKKNLKNPILYITSDDKKSQYVHKILTKILPDYNVLSFPAWDNVPYDNNSPTSHIISKRIETLYQLAQKQEKTIVITTINSFLTKVLPKDVIKTHIFSLKKGNSVRIDDFSEFLIKNSYLRVPTVNEQGEFAVRGDIIDIFPSSYQNPVRIDLFGDKIEKIKEFDAITQISVKEIKKVEFLPAREVILNEKFCNNFKNNYRKYFDIHEGNQLYEAVQKRNSYIGIENYLPLFYNNKLDHILDFLQNPIIFLEEEFLSIFQERIAEINRHYQDRIECQDQKYNAIKPELLYCTEEEISMILKKHQKIFFNNFDSSSKYAKNSNIREIPNFLSQSSDKKKTSFALFKEFLAERKRLEKIQEIIVASHNEISIKRLKNIFSEYQINDKELKFIQLPLESGFFSKNIIFVSEQDLLGRKILKEVKKQKRTDKLILEISSLSIGEFIVHQDHGIGKFVGLKILELTGIKHDFLQVEYLGGDKLYIPVENLDVISRYGGGGAVLDKLGSGNFQGRKAKLKKRIKDIAEDLLRIASERNLKKGIRFNAEDNLYEEFVARFPYDETEDQLLAIEDVLNDLASGKNMDRLICGDVGFGKTEIAMRASFAVASSHSSSKKPQIAIIVPTTLLARQHFANFSERFKDFGFNIAQLSRMVSQTQLKKTKEELENGEVDIVIGTHSLLSKNIKFNNLALAILDEEQHFGVVQKERIKEFKNNVHLLSLSATPIPRTLQMSLNNIRDMSLLSTAPVDRLSIRSFVMLYDEIIIRDAILREHFRGGRVFFVCPRIKDLEMIEIKLKKLVPEIKYAVAHGKLKMNDLDDIMNDFCDGKYDLLLSTTILESGIDIPEANTMIIHNANNFGLSQLYQLRGRVGRGNIRAYCYFTYDKKVILTDDAKKRLKVMQTLDGLGAGFMIASHDLDIRGAGNILGEEQSGKIREVGIELYQDMLKEEIAKLQHRKEAELIEEKNFSPIINIGFSIFIDENYIKEVSVRMEFYRRIANLKNEEEAENILLELEDRFGSIPNQTVNLVDVIRVKNKCKKANIEKLDFLKDKIVVIFFENKFHNPSNLMNYVFANKLTSKITPSQKLIIDINSTEENRIIKICKILDEIIDLI